MRKALRHYIHFLYFLALQLGESVQPALSFGGVEGAVEK
jgi:hypothetical protein